MLFCSFTQVYNYLYSVGIVCIGGICIGGICIGGRAFKVAFAIFLWKYFSLFLKVAVPVENTDYQGGLIWGILVK